MRKSLIISVVWLWGTWAFGQCGSARDTDLDGPYVSSTSTDPCSGTGHVAPIADNDLPRLQRYFVPYRSKESSASVQFLVFGRHYDPRLVQPLVLADQFKQVHDGSTACLHFSGLPAVNGSCRTDRKMVLRAALERGWQ